MSKAAEVATVSSAVDKAKEGEVEDDFERSAWGGKLEFILTCIGFAVGLGNVWRFPYLVYENGGGAFLIPYALMLFFVGLPLFYMEVSFGQFASLGPITAYSVSPVFKGVGVAGIVVAAYIVLYYNIIVAWCLYYFFASMTTELPWVSCNNWWNTEFCIEPGTNISSSNSTNVTFYTSSEEYFYNYVLRITDGLEEIGGLRWQLVLCLLLAWCTIFLVLIKGIASLGKVSYFVSLFPYVLLTLMLIRGLTLPGASTGVEFYLSADFSRLLTAKPWADAATQIFYSLGISMGGLIAMASFNDFHNNILRDALIIPFVNCGTSFYAGFVIFSVLGYMAEQKGVDVSEVAAEGPGLVFVVYPEGLATMPGAPIWSVLFFFMMSTLGFSSQFSTSEGIVSAFIDEFPDVFGIGMRPTYMRMTLCVSFFLLGLPMVCEGGFYLFQIVDTYCAGYTLLVVAFFEIVAFQYVYGYSKFAEDIALMLGSKPGYFWQLTWRFISPCIIVVVFISKCVQQEPLTLGDYVYPGWGMAIAWCIVVFPMLVILAIFLYYYCNNGGYKVLKQVSKPSDAWGPARKPDRTGVYALPKQDQTISYTQEDIPYWLSNKPIMMSRSISQLSKPPSYNSNINNDFQEFEMRATKRNSSSPSVSFQDERKSSNSSEDTPSKAASSPKSELKMKKSPKSSDVSRKGSRSEAKQKSASKSTGHKSSDRSSKESSTSTKSEKVIKESSVKSVPRKGKNPSKVEHLKKESVEVEVHSEDSRSLRSRSSSAGSQDSVGVENKAFEGDDDVRSDRSSSVGSSPATYDLTTEHM